MSECLCESKTCFLLFSTAVFSQIHYKYCARMIYLESSIVLPENLDTYVALSKPFWRSGKKVPTFMGKKVPHIGISLRTCLEPRRLSDNSQLKKVGLRELGPDSRASRFFWKIEKNPLLNTWCVKLFKYILVNKTMDDPTVVNQRRWWQIALFV